MLDRHSDVVLSRNSWGDAIFAVITTPSEAAEIALEIQAELDPATLRSIGLPARRRDADQPSPWADFRAFRRRSERARTFYGTEVTVAARIEPRVPVGAIYTTQPFAAMIESDRNNYHFEYVGTMDLAKNYGVAYCTALGTNARLNGPGRLASTFNAG